MEFKEDTRYAYAVARVRALETHLLTSEKVQKIIDAQDPSSAWRETAGWQLLKKEELNRENTKEDLEKFLVEEIRYTNNLFLSLSNDPQLSNLFIIKYDFHNLKFFLKAPPENDEMETIQGKNGTIGLGLVPVEKLRESLKEKNFKDLPESLRTVIDQILETLKTKINLFYERSNIIDVVVDKKMFELVFSVVEKYPAPSSSFVSTLFRIETDINNLNICKRFKRLGRKKEFLSEALLEGGNLDAESLLERYEKNEEDKLNEFINLQLSTSRLQLDNLHHQTIYTAFGLEPLIVFLKRREKESNIIRMIILAKLQGLTNEEIKKEIVVKTYLEELNA